MNPRADIPPVSVRRGRRGFTFIEILAAMLFMAIVIPVAIQGITLANAVGVRAARKRIATELAARILNEAVVTQSWRDGDEDGAFEDEFSDYRWKITSASWAEDTMRLVTAEVTYKVQDREFTERLSTLADELTTTEGGLQ